MARIKKKLFIILERIRFFGKILRIKNENIEEDEIKLLFIYHLDKIQEVYTFI